MFDIPWQDLVLGGGNLVFFIALLPSIFSNAKPAFATSLMTALTLSSFSYTFYTLELWLSMAGATLGAGAWWTLAVQKFLIDKKR